MSEPLLHVSGLVTELRTARGPVRVLDGVELSVAPRQIVGLVGESGCGKSLTALSVLGLLPAGARTIAGEVRFAGQDLLRAGAETLRRLRGARMAMVFQEPMTALDPLFTVGDQVAEVIRAHGGARGSSRALAVEMLRQVGLADPERRAGQYPHQLSGGMRQRVAIAMALCCAPELLIADEFTTALDATVQAQMLELLRSMRAERNLAVLLISHDLAMLSQLADEVAVMYAGRVVERAPTAELFRAPRHPYTAALLACIPSLSPRAAGRRAPLPTLTGSVPAPWAYPTGCRFRDRCPRASSACEVAPVPADAPHMVACHHPLEARLPAPAIGVPA